MDRRSLTSAANGRKGGRPISDATLRTLAAREYISKMVEKKLDKLVDSALKAALSGDHQAREWLSNRGWGKAPETLVTEDQDGERLPITGMFIEKDAE